MFRHSNIILLLSNQVALDRIFAWLILMVGQPASLPAAASAMKRGTAQRGAWIVKDKVG
jgi:hypothetical protein